MRQIGTLAVVVLFAGVATANAPPPPPKFVPVDATVKLKAELKGYVLYLDDQGGGLPVKFDVSTEKAVPVPFAEDKKATSGRRRAVLLAVPEEMAAGLKTADDWKAARGSKNWVIPTMTVDCDTSVPSFRGLERVGHAIIIKGVLQSGFQTDLSVTEKYEKADEPKKPLALAEPGHLIGGVAAAISVTLGGLWLVRRKR